MSKTTIAFSIENDLKEKINDVALKTNRKKSAVVSMSIEYAIKQNIF